LAQLVAELGDPHDFADIVPTLLIERVDSYPPVSASKYTRQRADDRGYWQSGCLEYLSVDRRIRKHAHKALEHGNVGLHIRGGRLSLPPSGQSGYCRMNAGAVRIEVSSCEEWLSLVSDDAVRPPSHCLQREARRPSIRVRTGMPERGYVNDD
jgi:hypothetical protein